MISFPGKLFKNHFHASMLVLLTLLGGSLRFAWLDKPAIWGDESATLGRVCGSYQDLLDRLQYDGFGPMHYEVYWWIANGFPYQFEAKIEPVRTIVMPPRRRTPQQAPTSQPTEKKWLYPTKSLTAPVMMTPFVMRFIPALAGTLMIPAMYFLAVQLANRRVALIAATFTSVSAYLLVYSRDAKMYMHLWLFCTLSVACMLWWFRCAKVEIGGQPGLRAYRRVAWLGWLASSIAMMGIHATGAVILGLEAAFLFTHLLLSGIFHVRNRWSLLDLGLRSLSGGSVLCIAAAGMLVHHFYFGKFLERVEANPFEAGIFWVQDYNRDRAGPDLIKFASSAFLLSWEWPTLEISDNIPIRTEKAFRFFCYGTMAVCFIALFPWRRWRLFARRPDTSALHPDSVTFAPILGIFFLFCWLIVPAYAMYCRSIVGFFSPQQVASGIASEVSSFYHELSRPWRIVVIAIPGVALLWSVLSFESIKRWAIRIGLVLLSAGIIWGICQISFTLMQWRFRVYQAEGKPWESVWMPRYVGYLWPAFAVVLAMLIARLPTRPVRGVVIGAIVGFNLLNYAWRVNESEPPTDKIAFDVLDGQSENATSRAYTQVRHGFGAAPGMGAVQSPSWRYYMNVYGHIPVNPLALRMMAPDPDQGMIALRQNVSPQYIINDLKKSPQINRIIVWDKINAGWADVNVEDRLAKALGSSWRRVSERKYTAWEHWTWQEFFTARRREYVRNPVAAKPSTQPSVQVTQN